MKLAKKCLVLVIILISIFLIYKKTTTDHKVINYIALGDSVAEGMNSYGEIGYGYPDYINDYLKKKKISGFYTKGFAKSGYKTSDLKRDIEENKTINEDGKTINIRSSLRESNLVTISIGANDFLRGLNLNNIDSKLKNIELTKKEIDNVVKNVDELIVLVKKYAKEEIILIGYYNPLPSIKAYKQQIDTLVQYSNVKYEEIAEKNSIKFINIFDIFDDNKSFLPNPTDIHPNIKGYEAISKEIIELIKE